MQRGFIQMPILIAIIAALLGGGAYVAYEVTKPSQNVSHSSAATTTADVQATTIADVSTASPQTVKQNSVSIQSSTSNTSSTRKALSNSEIIKRVKPATVFIETTDGSGSGMIIDSNGYILTNAHVVQGVSAAKIKLSDERSLSAEVVGRDEIVDLAVLKIVGTNFSAITFGNSDDVSQGDDVFTLGYPFGLEGDVSFKEGTISRRINDDGAAYLETSAEIHPGNSGGPLVNRYGEVIGINSAGYGLSVQGLSVGETIKLAIPINVAQGLIPQMKSGRNIINTAASKSSSNQISTSDTSQYYAASAFLMQYFENIYQQDADGMSDYTQAWKFLNSNSSLSQSYAESAINTYDLAYRTNLNNTIPIGLPDDLSKLMYELKTGFSSSLTLKKQAAQALRNLALTQSQDLFNQAVKVDDSNGEILKKLTNRLNQFKKEVGL